MKVYRTFVAVLIAEDLTQKVAEVQSEAKKLAPDVKWVAPENVHVTLKFLGDVREDRLPQVLSAIEDALRGRSAFEMSLSGIGAFPNPERAKVVWIGIEKGIDHIRELAKAVESGLERVGFSPENRPFKAHVTIGRIKTSKYLGRLAEGMDKIEAEDMGSQKVTSIAVMQSELFRDGPLYTPMAVFELNN